MKYPFSQLCFVRFAMPCVMALSLLCFSIANANNGLSSLYDAKVLKGAKQPLAGCHSTKKPSSGNTPGQQAKDYSSSEHNYEIPDLPLVSMDGRQTNLEDELKSDKTILLNFIFTTCTTICPVLSASFHQLQEKLLEEGEEVKMISITIDPEFDTPEKLRDYAKRFNAGPQWRFLTGDMENIITIEKAFDAYRGAKMNHEPLTFMKATAKTTWLRINGIASAEEIFKEYQRHTKNQSL